MMKTALYLAVTMFVIHGPPAIVAGEDDPKSHPQTERGLVIGQSASVNWSEWPAYMVNHTTSKFTAGVSCEGTVGGYGDALFEFPLHSGITLLSSYELYIGGILRGDTLVSCANGLWSTYNGQDSSYMGWNRHEFFPHYDARGLLRSLRPIQGLNADAYRAIYVDTFTHESGLHWLLWGHTPLGLEVVQKSYSLDRSPYRNILLLDYTVTNIGADTVEGAYLGIQVDGDVYASEAAPYAGWKDDLVGSFRDLATFYYIDNNGDPVGGRFVADASTIDALGIRATRAYPVPDDTNFNWWAHLYTPPEFGPRMRGTTDDPFREFPGGVWGTPSDDTTRYYLMSHKEWDYDQVLAPLIGDNDPIWLRPDSQLAVAFARGNDPRATMSIGPYDLAPGESMRAVFALFGAEFVHNDPDNGQNLTVRRWQEFYDNLNFFILRRTAEWALTLTDLLLDPTASPVSLEIVRMSADSAFFKWDPWVFPDVIAYRVELEPLEEFFPALSFTDRSPSHLSSGRESFYFPPDISTGVATGLEAGRQYVARMNHVLNREEGKFSPPLLIGNDNDALPVGAVQTCREFAFFDDENADVRISWEPLESDDVLYFKIYRADNSVEALGRYDPFISSDTATTGFHPAVCCDRDGFTYCLYQMPAYDSVAAGSTSYVDRDPVSGAYYWVTAVLEPGFESAFSELIKCEAAPSAKRDIVVIVGSTGGQSDYVYLDSVVSFYDSILIGYDYELYNWTDTNLSPITCSTGYCTDWRDLAAFKLIIIEEYPSPKVLMEGNESQNKLLTRLIDAGRHLAYFGTPSSGRQLNLNTDLGVLPYDSGSFEAKYFRLDSTILRSYLGWYSSYGSPDSLAGFNHALPRLDDLPLLTFDTSRHCLKQLISALFETGRCLPFTPAFAPNDRAEIIYDYGSLYPETSDLVGWPCGLLSSHDESRTYLFSFHLWAMKHADARELVAFMMTDPPQPSPPPLPGDFHLSQNYPNPFNQGTTISFNLSTSAHVELDLFNILGQHVRTLIDGRREAGPHDGVWDGRDSQGAPVASGVYLYRLKAGERSETKKMVLVR